MELLGRDRWSATRLVADQRGRELVEREFLSVPPGFAAHLPYLFSLARSLKVAGVLRPVSLRARGGHLLWYHPPARGLRLSRAEFRPEQALRFVVGLVRMVAELHSRALFGIELTAERLLVDSRHSPLFTGLLASPARWVANDGVDSLLLRELDRRVDLEALGEVLGQVADRAGGGALADRSRVGDLLRDLSRALRAAEPSQRPDLDAVARVLAGAGSAVVLPPRGPFLPRPALAGREAILREIEGLLERALREPAGGLRRPQMVVLSGRPGFGKTRLLATLAARARGQGTLVLAARSRADDRRLLGPLADVLEALREEGGAAGASVPTQAMPLPPVAERRRLLEQAVRSLLVAVRDRPTLILVEDIDLLPVPALEALSYFARDVALEEPEAARLALLVSLRAGEDPELAAPVSRMVDDLREEGFAERVRLPPLDDPDSALLLASMGLDDEDERARLVARGGGVPRLLDQLARLGRESRRDGAPTSVSEAFRRRLRALPAGERRALEAIAILGGRAPITLISALLPATERPASLGTLLRLVGRHLVEPSAGPIFELVARDSLAWVLERIPAARTRALHRLAGRAIEAGSDIADPQVLAFHYQRGGEKARFLAHGRRAAAILESAHANELALDLVSKMLPLVARRDTTLRRELLERSAVLKSLLGDNPGAAAAWHEILALPHDPKRAWWYYKSLGEVLRDAEDYAAAAEAFDRGLASLGPGENLAVADLLSEKAPILARLGEVDTARGLAEMAGSLAAGLPDSRELAEVHNRLGATLKFVGDYERAVSHIESGLRISEQVGAFDLAAIALNNLATYLSVHGQGHRAIELALRSLEIHQRIGDVNAIATTAVNIGALYLRSYDLDHARQYLEMGLRMARRFGKSFIVSACLSNLAELNFQRGRYGEAIDSRQRALRIAERLGRRQEFGEQLVGLSVVYALLGSAADTERVARRLLALATERDDPRLTGIAQIGLAGAARLAGDLEGARKSADTAERLLREIGASDWLVMALLLLAELALATERLAEALARAGEALAIGAEGGFHPDRAEALLLLAEALLPEDPTAAERAVREAEGIAEEIDRPELAWRCEYLAGELALRKGDRTGAARRFVASREILDRIAESIGDRELTWSYMRDRRRVSLLRRAREYPA